MRLPEGSRIIVMAPVVRGRKGEHQKEFESARKSGFVRVRVDGNFYDLSEEISLDKNRKHNIEVVVDRLVCRKDVRPRLADSVETASSISGGRIVVSVVDGEEFLYSQDYACPEHGVSIEELAPRMFSFNNPFGACKTCDGLGVFMKIDPELVVPNPKLSLAEGAIQGAGWHSADKGTIARMYYDGLAEAYGFDVREPFGKLPKEAREAVLFGTKGKKLAFRRSFMGKESTFEAPFEGVISNLERRYKESSSEAAKAEVEALMCAQPCPDCHGARLNEKKSGGHGRRDQHRSVLPQIHRRCAEFCRKPPADGAGADDRPPGAARGNRATRLFAERGAELFDPVSLLGHIIGRGEPAHSSGHPDRFLSDGGALYSG